MIKKVIFTQGWSNNIDGAFIFFVIRSGGYDLKCEKKDLIIPDLCNAQSKQWHNLLHRN